MRNYDDIDPRVKKSMNEVAALIDHAINPDGGGKFGFTLLVFEYGHDARMNYISNAQRADMICAMKEMIAKFEGRYAEGTRQ